MAESLGAFPLDRVACGDCRALAGLLPCDSVDVIVTSPPYWGQRTSDGLGVEEDPRDYLESLLVRFEAMQGALKPAGLLWINLGDAYNTPVNWRRGDHRYSSLGPDGAGLDADNAAYVKPRHRRKAFVAEEANWLRYGNLLALPYRMVIGLCERGFLFRGEVIWRKGNPLPEGKCRRPHRAHEGIYLFAKAERHVFRVAPPVRSVWDIPPEGPRGVRHYSRFPTGLPLRCIRAYGRQGRDVVVLDPFAGSGTTGVAALTLGCAFVGFEIDPDLVAAANDRLARVRQEIDGQAPLEP